MWERRIPAAAPIVIEICLYRVALGRNASVVPEKILASGFVDQIIDLRADFGQDRYGEVTVGEVNNLQSSERVDGHSKDHTLEQAGWLSGKIETISLCSSSVASETGA